MCASDQPITLAFKPWRLALLLALAVSTGAHAADREQEQLKRLKMQMRQLQQDQASAQEAQAKAALDKANAEKALKSVQSEVQGQRQAAGAASRRASALAQEVSTLKEEQARLNEQVAQLTKQLQAANETGERNKQQWQESEADLKGKSQALSARLDQCRTHNAQLYQLGTDILARYEGKGLGDVLADNEPFLQLGRVTLENAKAEYQDKLDAARLKAAAPAGGALANP